MFVCGLPMGGKELQQKKLPDCIRVEVYLLTAACLYVNYAVSMFHSPMGRNEFVILSIVLMNKAKTVPSEHSELDILTIMVFKNMIYQSA